MRNGYNESDAWYLIKSVPELPEREESREGSHCFAAPIFLVGMKLQPPPKNQQQQQQNNNNNIESQNQRAVCVCVCVCVLSLIQI